MKLFTCDHCGQRLYFENVTCTRCSAKLGFVPESLHLVALEPLDSIRWRRAGGDTLYRLCANYVEHAVCNWLVHDDDPHAFCVACRLNRTIPDLGILRNLDLWRALETEKRRLIYSLLRLGLPLLPHGESPTGLAFDFLADTAPTFSERGRVFTGHAHGLITINIDEADPSTREQMRDRMAEPYRTLLGHFRHESGHYYWDRLVHDTDWLPAWRDRFGDETLDYGQALDWHYRQGPPAHWQDTYISAYASTHPWEDWAETWAHYLHIVDTLETAWQFGLQVKPRTGDDQSILSDNDFDPYRANDIGELIAHWLPLSFALNSLNRSMGHDHAYPFVLSPLVIEKLGLVQQIVRGASADAT